MIKSWYLHVREETMAPARMVSFIEEHAAECEICLQDSDLKEEIAKITELVLPESKIPKAVRQKATQVEESPAEKEVDDNTEDDNTEDDTVNDEDDEEPVLDDN